MGFAGAILQIVMSGQFEQSIRQSGAIYLKNFISHFWQEREVVGPNGDALSNFSIHENDKKVSKYVYFKGKIVHGYPFYIAPSTGSPHTLTVPTQQYQGVNRYN